eukprot:5896227-Pyramimonas_sp.AAC.1
MPLRTPEPRSLRGATTGLVLGLGCRLVCHGKGGRSRLAGLLGGNGGVRRSAQLLQAGRANPALASAQQTNAPSRGRSALDPPDQPIVLLITDANYTKGQKRTLTWFHLFASFG